MTFGKKIRQQLDVKQHAFPFPSQNWRRDVYMSEMYIINVQLIEKKTSEKRTKKQPKNSFICALKKQAKHNYFINNTHKDNNNNNNNNNESDIQKIE